MAHQAALEAHLYQQERDLFSLTETVALYDLTNTFFEGTASGNPKAKHGHSKEKRSDCPLVTLGLVLDASGFPKRSQVFAGNVSEPKTLEQMLQHLAPEPSAVAPTVVLDAGIATEANLAWLTKHGYRYLVVSRERHKQFDTETAVLIRAEGDTQIRAQRVVDEVSGEVRLYCHSTSREAKERGIERRFSTRLEADLQYLAEGLQVPGRVKRYLGVVEEGRATDIVHPQQRIEAAVLVPLEVAANRVRVDQQGIGDIGGAPPVAKKRITALIRYASRTFRVPRCAARSSASSCLLRR